MYVCTYVREHERGRRVPLALDGFENMLVMTLAFDERQIKYVNMDYQGPPHMTLDDLKNLSVDAERTAYAKTGGKVMRTDRLSIVDHLDDEL